VASEQSGLLPLTEENALQANYWMLRGKFYPLSSVNFNCKFVISSIFLQSTHVVYDHSSACYLGICLILCLVQLC
jgi:hypothetical protein